ncbi:hypothetical protein SLITO_v1c05510 [Spiroplasma litorale]|uniref:Uncharacterized protein n=1 Tax=Spiroplasma litorale TaxID=216942 RepID=A0A0K1W1Y0_9MOLU|nr:hypothetical protein [Spiroplasma litorale]AKX34191.1 hypothetical protein SLITO_v1c05510 [Spiroplasma litorale]
MGIAAFLLIVPILVIVFGSIALAKKSNKARIACGVLSLVGILFAWAAYFIPLVLFLIGGILTLCGKAE